MAAAPVAVGDVLAGKYRVEQVVGAGAMGTIVAAWHMELDQRVAMKFLHAPGVEGGDPAERFRREARALARIKSEHVARVLDVGSLQDGMPYMVMEFLDGNNLSEEIRGRGPLPVVEAVSYILQAIEVMAEAHAAGIVHRDLKPANLFLARRPDGGRILKVLDFGISKSLLGGSRDELALTKTASLLGSPLYMSPEQVRCAKDVDARTDIWALGVIVYEMLTGRTPYNGDSVPQLFASLLHEVPPTMAQLRPDIPRELDTVVMHCLAKEPEHRWRNVGDLAYALLGFGPAGGHVHVERARRVLGLSDTGLPRLSQPGVTFGPPGAPFGPPGALTGGAQPGARLSVPHGGPSHAASVEMGPTVSSWSQTGQPPRAGRKSAFVGLALASVAALAAGAAISLGAVLFLRSGGPAGDGQAPAPAATLPPETAAPEPAREAPEPAREAAPGAASAASGAAALAAPEPPAPASGAPAAPPPAASSSPPAPAAAPPASAVTRPAERPKPDPGARPEPRRSNEISDFGGRR